MPGAARYGLGWKVEGAADEVGADEDGEGVGHGCEVVDGEEEG